MSHTRNKLHLYRRSWFQASILVLALCIFALTARAFQRSSAHKLRATGLLELTTDPSGTVTTRLYPITILADGRFRDATIYESKPRPLALGTGVVYEAQKTGTPVGYLTVNGASNTLQGWVGEGKWQLPRDTKASSTPKPAATAAPPPDDRPILHRGSGDSTPAQQPEQPAPPPTPPSDDRPVLHRSGTDNTQQSTPSPNTPPASQTDTAPQPDADRPVLRRRAPGNDAESSPPTPAPKTATTSPAAASPAQTITTKPLPPSTPGVQTYVAVSDAQTSDVRSYEYTWRPDEKEKIEAKMRKLALAQLPGEGSQTNEHSLTNVVVRSFDLDMSNDAVVVITAEAPGAYLPSGPKTARGAAAPKPPPDKFVSRYITVIARVDIDGNPQKLAASVTDSSRLDVAPRLELIDAVDVDGDGLAELLFREYDFDQKSFLVYGVGHGTVTKVFEGASVPLK